ncbi:hypothetical protein H0H81_009299, partial [Sphagnurus paluster]
MPKPAAEENTNTTREPASEGKDATPHTNTSKITQAGAGTVLKRSEEGKAAPQFASGLNDSQVRHSEITTCWIAAERALQHARSRMSSVSCVFHRRKIQESEYVVLAGFDESIIRSSFGYLEQIHVFTSAKVKVTSALLSELGRLFSPFSSILFTESSSYHMPVFKDDGNVWEYNELARLTAISFTSGESRAKMPLTVISLSHTHTPSPADRLASFSQGGSKSGEGDKTNNDDPDNNPEKLSKDKLHAGLAKISFKISSDICSSPDEQNVFQTLAMQGSLTIE